MVKDIVKDEMFLSQMSEEATVKDKYIATDLLDTLKSNKDRCVGLAANMIGYNKKIICVSGGLYDFVMINPIIINKSGEYLTDEVDYLDINFNKQRGKYTGFVAEIIQHEIDHTNGIII